MNIHYIDALFSGQTQRGYMTPIHILLIIISISITPLFSKSISPSDQKIRFTGVVEVIDGVSGMELYRFKKSYIDADWKTTGGAWAFKNALTQAGITIQIKTASPTVAFNFKRNTSVDDRWAEMTLYRNGIQVQTLQLFNSPGGSTISATSTDGLEAVWTCVMPSFNPQYFMGIDIDENEKLLELDVENKPIYVAIGNSITHGVGQSGSAGNLSYPYLVAKDLGAMLYNFGIGGSKFNTDVLENLDGLVPDVITVLWGYNNVVYLTDDLSTSLVEYDSLMTRLVQNYPNAKVVAIEQTYTSSTVGKNNTSNTIADLRMGQKVILERLMDLHNNLQIINGLDYTDANSLADVVHLNDAGAEALAKGIISELELKLDSVIEELGSDKRGPILIPVVDGVLIDTQEPTSVSILDFSGSLIQSFDIVSHKVIGPGLKPGQYIIRVFNENVSESVGFIKK
jgi:hypothetical protein